MVRVLGNSPERIKITDLGDVIYYRQRKDYTDQDFERSRDLQRELSQGHITILERFKTGTASATESSTETVIQHQVTNPGVSAEDIKNVVSEVLARHQSSNASTVRDILNALAPTIGDTIRQELSKISVVQGSKSIPSTFIGPEYIPNINTDDMTHNIKAEERTSSTVDVSSSLDALRKFKKST